MNGWTRLRICPICAQQSWCTLSPEGDAIRCMTAMSDRPMKLDSEGKPSWLHPLPSEAAPKIAAAHRDGNAPKLSRVELEGMLKQFETALSPVELEKFAVRLGVSIEALKLLQVGLDPDSGMIAFPMYDGQRILCGFRLRDRHEPKQRKTHCVRGSRNGLFIPTSYKTHPDGPNLPADHAKPMLLVLPEGPTDVAAALDLGFRAIGRPQNTGGGPMIFQLLNNAKCRQDVVIVADNDPPKTNQITGETSWPGIEGALSVAGQILPACGRLRVLELFTYGVKDMRKYKEKHGPSRLIHGLIQQTPTATREWIASRVAEVEKRKEQFRVVNRLKAKLAMAS